MSSKLFYKIFQNSQRTEIPKSDISDRLVPDPSAAFRDVSEEACSPQHTTRRPVFSQNISRIAAAELAQDLVDVGDVGTGLWEPLHHRDSIRLIQLFRDPASCLLGFTVSEHRLSAQPRYIALSYTWGKVGNISVIENVRGHRALRRNLNAFLNTLCNRIAKGELDESSLFWVDALCINQESLEEKSHQVEQIGQTFGQAEKIIVWLGTHQDTKPGCLESVFGSEARKWRRFSTHEYWTRIWIIQEFILANQVLLMDEVLSIPAKDLQAQLSKIPSDRDVVSGSDSDADQGSSAFHDSLMGRIVLMRHVEKSLRLPLSAEAYTLPSLVARFREQSSTDPRDKVYALLSLTDPQARPEVDYRISVGSLFWRVLCSSLLENVSLEIPRCASALGLDFAEVIPPSLIEGMSQEDNSSSLRIRQWEWERQRDEEIALNLRHGDLTLVAASIKRSYDDNTCLHTAEFAVINYGVPNKKVALFTGSIRSGTYVLQTEYADLMLFLHNEPDERHGLENYVKNHPPGNKKSVSKLAGVDVGPPTHPERYEVTGIGLPLPCDDDEKRELIQEFFRPLFRDKPNAYFRSGITVFRHPRGDAIRITMALSDFLFTYVLFKTYSPLAPKSWTRDVSMFRRYSSHASRDSIPKSSYQDLHEIRKREQMVRKFIN